MKREAIAVAKSSVWTIVLFPVRHRVLSLLSLLFVATAVAVDCTRRESFTVQGGWQWGKQYVLGLEAHDGYLDLDLWWPVEETPPAEDDDEWEYGPHWLQISKEWVGFSRTGFGFSHISYSAKAPLWLVALFLAVYPVFASYRLYRNRPPPPGHCQSCGYNLTGNVSGVCPECGAAVDADAE